MSLRPLTIPQSRSILIQCSTNQVTPSLLGRPTSSRCSPKVQLLEKSVHGAMTRRQKILQKVGMTPGLVTVLMKCADATTLDTWVLDQLRILFRNASQDATLNSNLHEDKVIFFMHLLGLDTTGHSYRPHSEVSLITRSWFTLLKYTVRNI